VKRQLILLVVLAVALMLGACTSSRKVLVLDMPGEEADSVAAKPVDVGAYLTRYGDYDGVYLEYSESVEHSGRLYHSTFSNWTVSWIGTDRHIVFNPDNTSLTTVTVPVLPTKMYVRTIDPDGKVRTWGRDCLVPAGDTTIGPTMYRFAIPNVRRGTIVEQGFEFAAKVKGVPPVLAYEWPIQFPIPCEHLKLTYAYPNHWAVIVKRLGPGRVLPYETTEDKSAHKLILTYEARDVQPLRKEQYAPFDAEVADRFALKVLDTGVKTPDKRKLKNLVGLFYDLIPPGQKPFKDWSELAHNVRAAKLGKAQEHYPWIDSLTPAIIAGVERPVDRVRAVLNFVRSNIEVANWSVAKGNAAEVLNSGKGDGYDMCELTRAMLASAGLKADVVLLHNRKTGYFDPEFLSGDEFSHLGVRVVTDDATYLLSPAVPNVPYDYISPVFQGQPALVIAGDSIGSIVRMPDSSVTGGMLDEGYDITIDTAGLISVSETKSFVGQMAYLTRIHRSKESRADDPEDPRIRPGFRGGDVTMIDSIEANTDDYVQPLMVSLKYTVAGLITITPEEILFRTGGLLAPISYTDVDLDVAHRQNPVRISYDAIYRKRITIHYPPQWKLVSDLPDVTIDNACGTAEQSASVHPGTIDIWQQVSLRHCTWPKEKVTDLAALIGTQSVVEQPTLVFSVEPVGM